MMPFFCIHISQGSVATRLKRGGIFKHEFVANLLPSWVVNFFFKNRIIFSEVMAKSLVSCFFDSPCSIKLARLQQCGLLLSDISLEWVEKSLLNLDCRLIFSH